MKISTMLKIIVIVLLSFSVVSTASVFYQLKKMANDSEIINYSGRQRAISQRLAKYVFAKHLGIDTDEEIQGYTERLDKIIKGLINGDKDFNLPKATDSKVISKMKEVEASWQKYQELIKKAENDKTVFPELLQESEKLIKLSDQATNIFTEISETKVTMLKTIQTVIFALNVIMLAFIWIINKKKVAIPLKKLTEAVEDISKGNLNIKVQLGSKGDEIHALSCAMEKMVTSIKKTINGVLDSSVNVISSVDVLQHMAHKTAKATQNQSNHAHQIATAAEEMSQTITDIARNAASASETAEDAMKTASQGKEVSDNAIQSANRVHASTEELASMIEKLNNRASEIGDIVTVIKDIADQTNLLALNAAIEAARAGEQGRGFAVVADEVRKLAEKTIKATVNISGKINAIQQEITQTTESMTYASNEVTKVTDEIKQLGESLNHIVQSVNHVKDQITQIATAVEEQSSVSEEVVRNIEKSSAISKELEGMAGDVMHQVDNLLKISEEMRDSVTAFKTDEMIFDLAKIDHRIFIGKVAACLNGNLSLDPSQLTDHHNCRFGKWYFEKGIKTCGSIPAFKLIDEPHAKIHALAKEAVEAYNAGDKEKAEKIYEQMEEVSKQIINLLDQIKMEQKTLNSNTKSK
ncbi:methyl-accepting chemotaxis protein [Thermodesulfovibrio thiophilus]|uniref:methyl-accepting chemotaxis protein n=1 Tax=Thermodesulfovibrio thiophilus TaxID=340095 RepID=UPI00040E9C38|nr:methyl-accepting chemotaxis protein [Thermodesulfovibrio thiophilus]